MKKINLKYITNILKPFTCGLLISSICLGSTFYASAAEHWEPSNPFYVEYSGVRYTITNTVYTGILNSKKFARAGISVSMNYNVPAYYVSIKPALCDPNNNNAVIKAGEWYYNDGSSSQISRTVSLEGFQNSPSYCALGYASIRTSSGSYAEYRGFASPALSNYSELS